MSLALQWSIKKVACMYFKFKKKTMSRNQSYLQHWCLFWVTFNKIWSIKPIYWFPNLFKGACILWRISFKISMRISYIYRFTFDRFSNFILICIPCNLQTEGKEIFMIKIKELAHLCSWTVLRIKGSWVLKGCRNLILNLESDICIHISIYR